MPISAQAKSFQSRLKWNSWGPHPLEASQKRKSKEGRKEGGSREWPLPMMKEVETVRSLAALTREAALESWNKKLKEETRGKDEKDLSDNLKEERRSKALERKKRKALLEEVRRQEAAHFKEVLERAEKKVETQLSEAQNTSRSLKKTLSRSRSQMFFQETEEENARLLEKLRSVSPRTITRLSAEVEEKRADLRVEVELRKAREDVLIAEQLAEQTAREKGDTRDVLKSTSPEEEKGRLRRMESFTQVKRVKQLMGELGSGFIHFLNDEKEEEQKPSKPSRQFGKTKKSVLRSISETLPTKYVRGIEEVKDKEEGGVAKGEEKETDVLRNDSPKTEEQHERSVPIDSQKKSLRDEEASSRKTRSHSPKRSTRLHTQATAEEERNLRDHLSRLSTLLEAHKIPKSHLFLLSNLLSWEIEFWKENEELEDTRGEHVNEKKERRARKATTKKHGSLSRSRSFLRSSRLNLKKLSEERVPSLAFKNRRKAPDELNLSFGSRVQRWTKKSYLGYLQKEDDELGKEPGEKRRGRKTKRTSKTMKTDEGVEIVAPPTSVSEQRNKKSGHYFQDSFKGRRASYRRQSSRGEEGMLPGSSRRSSGGGGGRSQRNSLKETGTRGSVKREEENPETKKPKRVVSARFSNISHLFSSHSALTSLPPPRTQIPPFPQVPSLPSRPSPVSSRVNTDNEGKKEGRTQQAGKWSLRGWIGWGAGKGAEENSRRRSSLLENQWKRTSKPYPASSDVTSPKSKKSGKSQKSNEVPHSTVDNESKKVNFPKNLIKTYSKTSLKKNEEKEPWRPVNGNVEESGMKKEKNFLSEKLVGLISDSKKQNDTLKAAKKDFFGSFPSFPKKYFNFFGHPKQSFSQVNMENVEKNEKASTNFPQKDEKGNVPSSPLPRSRSAGVFLRSSPSFYKPFQIVPKETVSLVDEEEGRALTGEWELQEEREEKRIEEEDLARGAEEESEEQVLENVHPSSQFQIESVSEPSWVFKEEVEELAKAKSEEGGDEEDVEEENENVEIVEESKIPEDTKNLSLEEHLRRIHVKMLVESRTKRLESASPRPKVRPEGRKRSSKSEKIREKRSKKMEKLSEISRQSSAKSSRSPSPRSPKSGKRIYFSERSNVESLSPSIWSERGSASPFKKEKNMKKYGSKYNISSKMKRKERSKSPIRILGKEDHSAYLEEDFFTPLVPLTPKKKSKHTEKITESAAEESRRSGSSRVALNPSSSLNTFKLPSFPKFFLKKGEGSQREPFRSVAE